MFPPIAGSVSSGRWFRVLTGRFALRIPSATLVRPPHTASRRPGESGQAGNGEIPQVRGTFNDDPDNRQSATNNLRHAFAVAIASDKVANPVKVKRELLIRLFWQ
jgi:hypothetical protein